VIPKLKTLDRRLWLLAWPLILTNITVPLLGLVDTAVLGHLEDPQYLGAVAVGSNLFTVIYWTFSFMRMGTTGLAAQAFGRRDEFSQTALLVRSLLLALIIGLLLIAFHSPIIRVGLYLMGASEDVTELASGYASIRIWSAPAVLCQYTLVGWLIGTQYPRGPMIMLIAANAVNIVLDVLFVTGFGWNSQGVAVATVFAEYICALIGLWLVWQRRPENAEFSREILGKLGDFLEILQVNRYIMVRTILLLFSLAFFTAQGAQQSDTILAANAVLFTFLLLISNGLDGFANGAEALVGEAVGQKDPDHFLAVCKTALRWSVISAAVFTVIFMVAGGTIINLLTSIEPVNDTARNYLPWIWALPAIAVWSFLLDGIFIGATRTRDMQNAMIFSVLVVYLPVWWLTQELGNNGLWLAIMSLMLARAVSMGWLFFRHTKSGRWFV